LAQAGIEIGSHTRTHANVGRIKDLDLLRDEIVGSRDELQKLAGTPIRYFAFPYGQHANLSPAAFALARESGYEAACSAYGGFNFPGDDPFHVQRIHGDSNMIQMKNWATLDPRKLHSVKRYEYQPKSLEAVTEPEEAFA
jgi:peptidoglycan/xylan/chitin deacetylase (PgdA/CDA1 family)